MHATEEAVADELACVAGLVCGKDARVPACIIRGYRIGAATAARGSWCGPRRRICSGRVRSGHGRQQVLRLRCRKGSDTALRMTKHLWCCHRRRLPTGRQWFSVERKAMQGLSWCNRQTLQSTTWNDVQRRVSHSVASGHRQSSDLARRRRAHAARNVCCWPMRRATICSGWWSRPTSCGSAWWATSISYVVTRNINFTNVCFVGCKFCAFSVGPRDETAYFLSLDEVAHKCREAEEWGATEVCIQGGLPRESAAVLLPRHSAGGEVGDAEDACPRLLADGDGLRRRAHGHAHARVPADAEGKRAGHACPAPRRKFSTTACATCSRATSSAPRNGAR